MTALLVIHAAATWFMVGLIWVIQTVHYPLFADVGRDEFTGFEARHTRRMGRLLVVPATTEVVTAAALVWFRPEGVGVTLVLAAGFVLAALWVTTALIQAPLHGRLTDGKDDALIERLVRSNWSRTVGWSVRGVLVAAMVLAA